MLFHPCTVSPILILQVADNNLLGFLVGFYTTGKSVSPLAQVWSCQLTQCKAADCPTRFVAGISYTSNTRFGGIRPRPQRTEEKCLAFEVCPRPLQVPPYTFVALHSLPMRY